MKLKMLLDITTIISVVLTVSLAYLVPVEVGLYLINSDKEHIKDILMVAAIAAVFILSHLCIKYFL